MNKAKVSFRSLRRGIRAALCGAVTVLAGQPLTTLLFPRAEKALEDEGLDPALVAELAPGKRIYVRNAASPFAKLHAALDILGGAKNAWWDVYHNDEVLAYATPMPGNFCRIYIRSKQDSTFDGIAALRAPFRDAVWKNPALPSARDNFRQVLLHEIRHCSDENHKLPALYKEADSDYQAIRVLTREDKRPGLKESFYRYTSMTEINFDTHDTILYMQAKDRGEALPTVEEMLEARQAAKDGVLLTPLALKRFTLLHAARGHYLAQE